MISAERANAFPSPGSATSRLRATHAIARAPAAGPRNDEAVPHAQAVSPLLVATRECVGSRGRRTAGQPPCFPEWVFTTALDELRGVIGILVAEIAGQYHLDVEGELVTILPADPDTERDGDHGAERWEVPYRGSSPTLARPVK